MNPTTIPAQYMETSAASQNPEDLGIIAKLTCRAVALEEEIARYEKLLDSVKKAHKQVTEVDIPERMTALGLTGLKTTEGHELTIKPFYQASLKREYERGPVLAGAFDWLNNNGHAGVIKTAIEVVFPKGMLDVAKTFSKKLAAEAPRGATVELDQGVHAATLKALFKELKERGETLPDEYFNTYSGNVAVVKKNESPI